MRQSSTLHTHPPRRAAVLLGFLAIYLVWGSTYLAIRYGVESIPPLLMAGARFALAGGILYTWCRLRGEPAPTRRQWGAAALIGNLLLLGGNGIVCWAEQWVPSGVTALLIASVPLWVALFQWVFEPAHRPRARGLAGLVLGFAGVAYLVNPDRGTREESRVLFGSFSLILASAFWAAGSVRSRHVETARSPLVATAMQMLMGSAGLLTAGILTGEPRRLDVEAIQLRSWLSLGYLITFGSIVAFSSYVWLLRVVSPSKVATYAYVNPVVAMLLGWALAGEPIGARTLAAAAVILGAVVLIQGERPSSPKRMAGTDQPTPKAAPWDAEST